MSSNEALGWMAAIASMLAFGSFGAPIKSEAANSVDIDPLVFQSYKSFMCFATSWIVLLAGVPFTYTPWGIVSCIFWVPGGVATVFAIRNAGLAIAIGIGSSSIVGKTVVWRLVGCVVPLGGPVGIGRPCGAQCLPSRLRPISHCPPLWKTLWILHAVALGALQLLRLTLGCSVRCVRSLGLIPQRTPL